MFKVYATCCLLLQFSEDAFNQQPSHIRFKDLVFKNVIVKKNIVYAKPLAEIKSKYYQLDFYEPAGDTASARPLIIWLHGGGFKFGKKTSRGTPIWSKTFAQRGYVCAAINYRLSKKKPLARFPDLIEGCFDAIADLKIALLFLKSKSRLYNIDTNRIILAGNSAGGMIALQACYHLDSTALHATTKDQAGVVAIVNFWGALFNINSLATARVPIVSVHGSKDRVVPIGGTGPLYGSEAIHEKADSLHIPNKLKIYEGYGHELQKHFLPFFAGIKAKHRWLEAGLFASDFLFNVLFEPTGLKQ